MSMPVWPLTLPQRPLVDGYAETPISGVISSPVEMGPSHARARHVRNGREITASYWMTRQQLVEFQAFLATSAVHGAAWVLWPDPVRDVHVPVRFMTVNTEPVRGARGYVVALRMVTRP